MRTGLHGRIAAPVAAVVEGPEVAIVPTPARVEVSARAAANAAAAVVQTVNSAADLLETAAPAAIAVSKDLQRSTSTS